MRRVVVTGMAAISTLGEMQEEMMRTLRICKNATQCMVGWEAYQGLRSYLYAPLSNYAQTVAHHVLSFSNGGGLHAP